MRPEPTFNSQQYPVNQLNPNISKQINQAQGKHQVREQTYRYKHSVRERAIKYVGIITIVFFVYQLASQGVKVYYATSSLSKINDQLTNVTNQNKDLKEEQEKLNSSDYLEQVLRDKYQYTKDGETIYNLPKSAE